MTRPLRAALAGSLVAAGAALVARAGLTLDIGVGRRLRPLGPIALDIAAPPELVFDVIAAPYLGRTPRALQGKLEAIERGGDLVRAAPGRRSSTAVSWAPTCGRSAHGGERSWRRRGSGPSRTPWTGSAPRPS